MGKSMDQDEHSVDFVLEILAESGLSRLVVVDLVVDLGDRPPMKSKLHGRKRAARRARTCARYSSNVIVSAVPDTTSAARSSISSSQAVAASVSRSPSRLRINSRTSLARSSAGSRRTSASTSVAAMRTSLASRLGGDDRRNCSRKIPRDFWRVAALPHVSYLHRSIPTSIALLCLATSLIACSGTGTASGPDSGPGGTAPGPDGGPGGGGPGGGGPDGGGPGSDGGPGGGGPGGLPSARATLVAIGRAHSCAVTTAGAVRCWGFADAGQLGNGIIDGTSDGLYAVPVQVQGLTSGVTAISSFGNTVCVVVRGGVKCWGENSSGQLGNNSTDTSAVPVDVAGLASGWAAVAVGGDHACALSTAGGVKCWGKNDYGQLGNDSTVDRSLVPVQVQGLTSGVGAIASGRYHACAAMTSAGVKCWGGNLYGELGIGVAGSGAHVPGSVSQLTGAATALGAGDSTSCAIVAGGLQCWGKNADGEIGNGMSGTGVEQHVPAPVTGIASGAALVSSGYGSMCAIVSGAAKCWGSNLNYTLGNGQGASFTSTSPVAVTGLGAGVTHLAAAGSTQHACAVTAGAVMCWGTSGAHLGTGDVNTNALSPVSVVSLP
jgi:Regulator of chromosome condensation (RCC1) repeat